MEGSLQTVQATLLPDGTVSLLQPIDIKQPVQAVVTFHTEESSISQDELELIKRRSAELHTGTVKSLSLDELKARVG